MSSAMALKCQHSEMPVQETKECQDTSWQPPGCLLYPFRNVSGDKQNVSVQNGSHHLASSPDVEMSESGQ
jgi:hypothetical protein